MFVSVTVSCAVISLSVIGHPQTPIGKLITLCSASMRFRVTQPLGAQNMQTRRMLKCKSGANFSRNCEQKNEVDCGWVRGQQLLSDSESLLAFKGRDKPHGAPTRSPSTSFSRCIDTALSQHQRESCALLLEYQFSASSSIENRLTATL